MAPEIAANLSPRERVHNAFAEDFTRRGSSRDWAYGIRPSHADDLANINFRVVRHTRHPHNRLLCNEGEVNHEALLPRELETFAPH